MSRRLASVVIVLAVSFRVPSGAAGQEPPSPDALPWSVAFPEAYALTAPADAPPALTAESVGAFFDAAYRIQRAQHALAGEVVSVVHRGRILFEAGYGWADLERRIPADPERSLFRIGSITKPFVWTAIMQLVDERRLDLEDEVERHIDFSIPDTFQEPIRIRHLLTHTAGFEETWLGWQSRSPAEVGALGEVLEELLPARVRPPGRHAAYSNYGAALSAYVVERVSGRPWAEYTEERILRPLGMASTNVRTEIGPELWKRHAVGYAFVDGRLEPTPYAHLRPGPAGLVSSTAHDMASFMLAHLNLGALGDARILSERTAKRMQSPLFAPYPELPPLLHGFYRSDRNGHVVFGHGGDVNRFHSTMILLPEEELGVFVSFNSDPGSAARSVLITAFLDHFFPASRSGSAAQRGGAAVRDASAGAGRGEYAAAAGGAETKSEPLDLSHYVGQYVPLRSAYSTFERVRSLFNYVTIEAEGDELVLGGGARLLPTAPDRFVDGSGTMKVVFERDGSDAVAHLFALSPLGSFQRVRGLEAPGTVRSLLLIAFWVSVAGVLGWGYRLFRPIPEARRLPSPHVRVAWMHALLTASCLFLLPQALGGIAYGLSPFTRTLFVVYNLGLGLGLLTLGYAARQWMVGVGALGCRCRYAVVALAALVNLWFAWSFNLVGAMM